MQIFIDGTDGSFSNVLVNGYLDGIFFAHFTTSEGTSVGAARVRHSVVSAATDSPYKLFPG